MNDKKTSYKGIIIFLIIFAILAVALTVFYARNVKIGKVESIGKLIDIAFKGEPDEIDYEALFEADKKYVSNWDETYFTNNIELIEQKYESGEIVGIDEFYNKKIYEEDVEYYQIDGLKDDEIEQEINDRLKEEAFKILQEESTYNAKRSYMIVHGNFSNILSVCIYSTQYNKYTNGKDEKKTYKYINIDLATGNDIKFEELFIKGTNIKNIITSCRYKQIQYRHSEREQFEDLVLADLQRIDFDNLSFTIFPDKISIFSKESIDINTLELLEKLTLYKRFLTEKSIFTDEYNNSLKMIVRN